MKKLFRASAAIMAVLLTAGIVNIPDTGINFAATAEAASAKLPAPEYVYETGKTKTSIDLTWGEVEGAYRYKVYKYDTKKKKYVSCKTVKGTSCTIKGLSAGKTYKFKVAAMQKNGSKLTVGKKSQESKVRTKFNFRAGDTVSCDMFSITLPAGVPYDTQIDKDSISVYDKEAKNAGFGGWAFDVALYESPADYSGMMDSKIGEIRATDGKIYDVVVMFPSDVQYDYEKYPDIMSPTFDKLYNGYDDIIKTLKAKDGTFVYGGGTTGAELYGEVLDKYKKALTEHWDASKLEKENMSAVYYELYSMGENDMLSRIGFTYRDLNGDGIDELLVGEITKKNEANMIFDIYTMVDRKPAFVASGWYRNSFYLYDYGVCNQYSESAAEGGVRIYDLIHNSTDFTPSIDFKYDYTKDPANPQYLIAYGGDDYEAMTEEEFEQRKSNFGELIHIDYTPFSSLK